ncbi:MAG: hypothetical protein Q4G09_02305 [Clostridia bacterium]|nr:hypothetical protein [Clostridia bacterium]
MEDLAIVLNEANQCLNCKEPMCRKGCPANTKIPDFIEAIKKENLQEAYYILQENNIMSDICSNVCPYEEYCIRTLYKRYKRQPSTSSKTRKICKFMG